MTWANGRAYMTLTVNSSAGDSSDPGWLPHSDHHLFPIALPHQCSYKFATNKSQLCCSDSGCPATRCSDDRQICVAASHLVNGPESWCMFFLNHHTAGSCFLERRLKIMRSASVSLAATGKTNKKIGKRYQIITQLHNSSLSQRGAASRQLPDKTLYQLRTLVFVM